MNHDAPALLGYAQIFEALYPPGHVLYLLDGGDEVNVVVQLAPLLQRTQYRHALQQLAARQRVVEKACQNNRPTGRGRAMHRFGDRQTIARAAENHNLLHAPRHFRFDHSVL